MIAAASDSVFNMLLYYNISAIYQLQHRDNSLHQLKYKGFIDCLTLYDRFA